MDSRWSQPANVLVGCGDASMKKKSLPLSRVYQLIEPGPVVMVSTSWRGEMNIMPMSWHMMVEFEPPILACIISNGKVASAITRVPADATQQFVDGLHGVTRL